MNKNNLFVVAFLLIFVLAGVVSASTSIISSSSVVVPTYSKSGSITLSATGNEAVSGITLSAVPSGVVSFGSFTAQMGNGTTQVIPVNIVNAANLKFGPANVLVNINSTNAGSTQVNLPIRKSFCSKGSTDTNLSIRNIEYTNNAADSEDDEWKPLNDIDIEVKFENNGDDRIKDVFVEMGLYDENGVDVASDLDFSSSDDEKASYGSLKSDSYDTVTFSFRVPADFEIGNYKLVIKVYSDDLGENVECADESSDFDQAYYQEISVVEEDEEGRYIVFDNMRVSPSGTLSCGDSATLSADVYNIGEDDEDQVKINLVSTDLKISTSQEFKQGIDQGDSRAVSFTFGVPEGLKDKDYTLKLSSEYDYKNGVYREESDEDTEFVVNVAGCTPAVVTPTKVAQIDAELDSDAQAGKEMIVTSTIKNLGTTSATFLISARGYEEWATLGDISTRRLELGAGESEDVTLKFLVNKDAAGEQGFSVEARSGDKTEKRDISVNIAKPASVIGSGSGSLIWIIALVNVVLIILIIVIAIRISRK